MRANGREQDRLRLDEAEHQLLAHARIRTAQLAVGVALRLILEESRFQRLLEKRLLVVRRRRVDRLVHFVREHAIGKAGMLDLLEAVLRAQLNLNQTN